MSVPPLSVSRRQFGISLGTAAVSAASTGAPDSLAGMPWAEPAQVRQVYLAARQITWPRPDTDIDQERNEIQARLREIEQRHASSMRFTGGEVLRVGDDVGAWAARMGDADAVLVIDLTSGISPLLAELRKVETPMVLFARPYSGWAYTDFANWRAAGKRVELTSSSDFGDLDSFVPSFRAIRQMRKSKVLVVAQGEGDPAGAYTQHFGMSIVRTPYQELKTAFEAASAGAAQREADAFTRGALRVVEPSAREIQDSMRFYLAVKDVLRREKANVMTIDCLGGFRRGDLPAYPCVAWSKLNDEGLYGVCEADVPAALTQLLGTAISGKPGFVSDPVFDVSRNEIIHAHCVSATCLENVKGAPSPYIIRSHMEDNKGVSLQVLVPNSGKVTVAKFAGPRKMLVSTGEVCGNVEDRRGCRTKFRTRVSDARKMIENYAAGLHRVVFWGDYTQQIARAGRLLGYEVVEEM